jgi:hypothetical protein
MSDADLVRRVRQLGSALRRAAQWQGSSIEVDSTKDDFVYELLCYISAALAATGPFEPTLILRPHRRTKKMVPLFPKKPGCKRNFSLLLLSRSNKIEFELCPGIFVEDRYGKRRAPDINLLCANAPEDPQHSHLCAIWDAKYVQDETQRVADTAVSDFVVTFEELGGPNRPVTWSNVISVQAFRASGLITNGCESTERPAMLKQRNVCETSGFPKKPSTRP